MARQQLKILALDLATHCGWAHSCGQSGVWDLSIKRDESSGMRLLRFHAKLHELARTIGVDVIVFESIVVASGTRHNVDGFRLGMKLQSIVETFCEGAGVVCGSRNLNEIKKHAIPKAPGVRVNRDKEAMLAAARQRWPAIEIVDDNQADALWLLDLVSGELVAGERTPSPESPTPRATKGSGMPGAGSESTNQKGD